MDPESKKLLQEAVELSRDNHAMLKKLRRSQKNAHMWKTIYWVVAIALTYAAYVKIKPYIIEVTNAYNQAQSQLDSIKNFGNSFGGKQ